MIRYVLAKGDWVYEDHLGWWWSHRTFPFISRKVVKAPPLYKRGRK